MLHIKTLTNLRTLGWSLCLWLRANQIMIKYVLIFYHHRSQKAVNGFLGILTLQVQTSYYPATDNNKLLQLYFYFLVLLATDYLAHAMKVLQLHFPETGLKFKSLEFLWIFFQAVLSNLHWQPLNSSIALQCHEYICVVYLVLLPTV